MASQSNLSPSEAASIWKQYIQPLHKSGVRLGAPAVSAAPGGRTWLSQFISACNGCTFDFIPLHWYGDGSQYFEQYVEDFHNQFKHPIWVTEWASTSSDPASMSLSSLIGEAEADNLLAAALQFLKDTTSFLDKTSYVERYSWFAFEVSDSLRNRILKSTHVTPHL